MDRIFAVCGAISGFLSVALGAFGAHVLKSQFSDELLAIFETAVRYQMYHALALLLVAYAGPRWHAKWLKYGGGCFIMGSVIFSGSLYVLLLSGITWLGAITPLGGLAFLAGWFCLVMAAVKTLPSP